MKLRDLLVEFGPAPSAPSFGDPGDGGGDPSGDPAPEGSSTATGRLFSNKARGGYGLSGQGYLPPNEGDIFLGHKEPQEKHNFKAVGQVGKSIDWDATTSSAKPVVGNTEDAVETDVEDNITEDASAGATASADIATVAYPLFVRGKNNKEKRKNARAAVGQKYVPGPAGIGKGVFESVDEAHVLGNDSVIYRLDREKPMSDTEVAVIGGAGRYTLSALRDKARREADQLARDLKVEHGGAFRNGAHNVKQLANTLNTIVAAYNELKRIRSKGGRGSRGITDEDANFIRECMGLVQRALKEGVAVEPDAHGYEKAKLTSPRYAVVVDTPSDYDWYKIGNHWHDRIIDPHEFGQEDSDTVMVASGEADFNDMLAKLDRMGFTYKLIGGTHSQPEIHKGNKR